MLILTELTQSYTLIFGNLSVPSFLLTRRRQTLVGTELRAESEGTASKGKRGFQAQKLRMEVREGQA